MGAVDFEPGTSYFERSFGLTGGVACGKSTVAGYFRELGAYIIDADRVGHQLIQPGQPAYQKIIESFGKDILAPGGAIDRKLLGRVVFAHAERLRLLNAILHPRIVVCMHEMAAEQRRHYPQTVVIVDAALIFEVGLAGALRKVMVAWCRPEQQIERLMAKLGISSQEAEQRIRTQMPLEEKRRRADYLIDCSGTLEHSRTQVHAIYPELESLSKDG